MITQDTCCQASPRYWAIMDYNRECWVEENTDGFFIYDTGCCEGYDFEDIDEYLVDWLKDLSGIENLVFKYGYIEFEFNDDNHIICDTYDLKDFLDTEFSGTYEVGYYREVGKVVENTMFLTLGECEKHLKENKHHYSKKAHSYSMTAWRSSQVRKLFEIIESFEFKED